MKFTPRQQRVIDVREKNILVSAAAGSGKTAVLVERILERLCDREHPADIDRMLIVTFTRAAAAELRERIGRGIGSRLAEQPDNIHLQRQSTLVHNAMITSIDSFCLQLLRSHFHVVDLDPSFRVADEGELKLLRIDVLGQVLEQSYAEADEDFLWFVECYAPRRTDAVIEEYVLRLYEFAMSHPFPEDWLKEAGAAYESDSLQALETQPFMEYLFSRVKLELAGCKELAEAALSLCMEPDGPYMYAEALETDIELIESMQKGGTLQQYYDALQKIAYKKLSSKRDETVSVNKREQVKLMRGQLKDGLTAMKKQYFYREPAGILEDMQQSGRAIRALTGLTLRFHRALMEAKREKNLVDFGDLEHYALRILLEPDGAGGYKPTQVAGEYQEFFAEIMIDEYQDSNLVQEYLLSAMAKGNNLFMVGDVKQSIYKFRMARPELFMEKYAGFPMDGSEGEKESLDVKIELHQNFRSRRSVVDSVNYLFYKLMDESVGGITYDGEAALYYGAPYPEETDGEDYCTELLLVQSDMEESGEEDGLPDGEAGPALNKKQLEARAVARRIRELAGSLTIYDKKAGEYRKARYADMVILLQTNAGWDDVFREMLAAYGIPAHTMSKTGYFSTLEIRTMLHYLRVLDNPIQDVPLAAVLKSIFGGFSDEELACIRAGSGRPFLYEAMTDASLLVDEGLNGKIQGFLKSLEEDRRLLPYMPVHELLLHIIRRTDYDRHISAMPAGARRLANLHMLLEKADAFEKTSYKGLFHFIRYIEQLQKYDVDFGEAEISGENEDTVRIMSIHKSKGLEFPVCFVCGISKQFNMQDLNQRLLHDMDFGIGAEFTDPVRRVKESTLCKRVIQGKARADAVGEALRLLYVALTRAEEKLIITGTVAKPEKLLAQKQVFAGRAGALPYVAISRARSFADFLLPALLSHSAFAPVLTQLGLTWQGTGGETDAPFSVRLVTEEEGVEEELFQQVEQEMSREIFLAALQGTDGAEEAVQAQKERLDALFGYTYPFESAAGMVSKLSVSELKKHAYESAIEEEEGETAAMLYEEEVAEPYVPAFLRQEEAVSGGAVRGTVYHRMLEHCDFAAADGLSAEGLLERMLREGRITEAEAAMVRPGDLKLFFESDLARRMARAARAGRLYKEQPFVVGVPANTIDAGYPADETVLVQGIIDVYFEEDGALVLADYKTDAVSDGGSLVKRYRVQLDYYAGALTKLTGLAVKEELIYSFALGEVIPVPEADGSISI